VENNLIVVLNAYDEFRFNSNTVESIRLAANRWKCSFLELTEAKHSELPQFKLWNKLWMIENLVQYDKVLYIDMDTIINSKCPNIFEELSEDQDMAIVKDGNPGRFQDNFFKIQYVDNIMNFDDAVNVFSKYFKHFNLEQYSEKYFNSGIMLFRPNRLLKYSLELKELIFKNPELMEFLSRSWATEQNILNGWFTSSGINIKYLDNTWNWIAPDMENHSLDIPMHKNIFHFCGTDSSKYSLLTYNNWK